MKRVFIILTVVLCTMSLTATAVNLHKNSGTPPVIDGLADQAWDVVPWMTADKIVHGSIIDADDFTITFKQVYDEDAWYVLINITDDVVVPTSSIEYYFENDGISLFFDLGNEKTSYPDHNDYQLSFAYASQTVYSREYPDTADITHAFTKSTGGYALEVRIPWSYFNHEVQPGSLMGFDLLAYDNDGVNRECQVAYSGDDHNYTDSSRLGTCIVLDKPVSLMLEAEASVYHTLTLHTIKGITFFEPNTGQPGTALFETPELQPGLYHVWVKIAAADPEQSKFRMSIDNDEVKEFTIDHGGDFHWLHLAGMTGEFDVSAVHTLTFYADDDQVRLDKLMVTNDMTFIPVTPTMPVLTGVTEHAGALRLTWEQGSVPGDTLILERKIADYDFEIIAELPGTAGNYTDITIDPGFNPVYRLKAVSTQDTSAYSNPYHYYAGIPQAPRNLEMQVLKRRGLYQYDKRVQLTWDTTTDNVYGYEIERRDGNDKWILIRRMHADEGLYIDKLRGYTHGPLYYRIRAYNGYGYSSYVYTEYEDDLITDLLYSTQNNDYRIINDIQTGYPLYRDIQHKHNRFYFLPDYLKETAYIQTRYHDRDNDDTDYITFTARRDLLVYLAVASDAYVNRDVWTPVDTKVMINTGYFPAGVDIYMREVSRDETVGLNGNRYFTHTGNTYLVFFREKTGMRTGINFGPGYTRPIKGYSLDAGDVYGEKENGLIYGWDVDASDAAYDRDKHDNYLTDTFIMAPDKNTWRIKLDNGVYRVRLALGDLYDYGNVTVINEAVINGKVYTYNDQSVKDSFWRDWKNRIIIEDVVTISPAGDNHLVISNNHYPAKIAFLELKKIDDMVVNRFIPRDDTFIENYYRAESVNGMADHIAVKRGYYYNITEAMGLFEFDLKGVKPVKEASLNLYVRKIINTHHHRDIKLKIYANAGFDFDEQTATWENTGQATVTDYHTGALMLDENLEYVTTVTLNREDRYYAADITDYLAGKSGGLVTFVVMAEGMGQDRIKIFSKEMGINPPYVAITTHKEPLDGTGYLTPDGDGGYILKTGESNDSQRTYIVESPYHDLEYYAFVNVAVTGYIDPVYEADHGTRDKLIIETITVIPPAPVTIYNAYWNHDGYPEWSWMAGDGGEYFRYKLDDGEWTESLITYFKPMLILSEGLHTLYVQCKNRLSDWSQSAMSTVYVDRTLPEITGMEYTSPTNDQTPLFTWTSHDDVTHYQELLYEYRFDNEPWIRSIDESYEPARNLLEGYHTFKIKVVDLAGNVSDIYTYDILIDITAPQITEILHESPTAATRPVFTWTYTDNYTPVGDIRCKYRLDSGEWTDITGFTYQPAVDLEQGVHMFELALADNVTNVSMFEYPFYVDLTPPSIVDMHLNDPTNNPRPVFAWEAADDYKTDGYITYAYKIDNDEWQTTEQRSITVDHDLADGEHLLRIIPTDGVGHAGKQYEYLFLVNTGKPQIERVTYHLGGNGRYYIECMGSDDDTAADRLLYSFKLDDEPWSVPTVDNRYALDDVPDFMQNEDEVLIGHPANVFTGDVTGDIKKHFAVLQIKVIDEADNESEIFATPGSKSKKIICTELYRQGLMDEDMYRADQEFGKFLALSDPDAMRGYHYLAGPVVKKMQESPAFTRLVNVIAAPWAKEMAYQMGAREKGSIPGGIIMNTGIVICGITGKLLLLTDANRMALGLILLLVIFWIGMAIFKYKKKSSIFVVAILLLSALALFAGDGESSQMELRWYNSYDREMSLLPDTVKQDMESRMSTIFEELDEKLQLDNDFGTDFGDEREYYLADNAVVLDDRNSSDDYAAVKQINPTGTINVKHHYSGIDKLFKIDYGIRVFFNEGTASSNYSFGDSKYWQKAWSQTSTNNPWRWSKDRTLTGPDVIADNDGNPIISGSCFPVSPSDYFTRKYYRYNNNLTNHSANELYWNNKGREIYYYKAQSPIPKITRGQTYGTRFIYNKEISDVSVETMYGIKMLVARLFTTTNPGKSATYTYDEKEWVVHITREKEILNQLDIEFDGPLDEGRYALVVGAIDKFNKMFVFDPQYFIIDGTSPVITPKAAGTAVLNTTNTVFNATSTDRTIMEWGGMTDVYTNPFNPEERLYIKTENMPIAAPVVTCPDVALDMVNKRLSLAVEKELLIEELYVTDEAGNKNYMISANSAGAAPMTGYVYDRTLPVIDPTNQIDPSRMYTMNDDFEITVVEQYGIDAEYTLEYGAQSTVKTATVREAQYTVGSILTIDKYILAGYEGDVTLTIDVTDDNGNTANRAYTFAFDDAEPELTVTLEGKTLRDSDQWVLHGPADLIITASDDNFEEVTLDFEPDVYKTDISYSATHIAHTLEYNEAALNNKEEVVLTITAHDDTGKQAVVRNLKFTLLNDREPPQLSAMVDDRLDFRYDITARDDVNIAAIYYKDISLDTVGAAALTIGYFGALPDGDVLNGWSTLAENRVTYTKRVDIPVNTGRCYFAMDGYGKTSGYAFVRNNQTVSTTIDSVSQLTAKGWNLSGMVYITDDLTINQELTISTQPGNPTVINFDAATPITLTNTSKIIIDTTNEEVIFTGTNDNAGDYTWFGLVNDGGVLEITGDNYVYFEEAQVPLTFNNPTTNIVLNKIKFMGGQIGIHMLDYGSAYNTIEINDITFEQLVYGVKFDLIDGYTNAAGFNAGAHLDVGPSCIAGELFKGITYDPVAGVDYSTTGFNSAPYIEDELITISEPADNDGLMRSGDDLAINYRYRDDDGDAEGGSVYQWYASANEAGPYGKVTNTRGWTIEPDHAADWVKVKVVPVDEHNGSGRAVYSEPIRINNLAPVVESVALNGTGRLKSSLSIAITGGDDPDSSLDPTYHVYWQISDMADFSSYSSITGTTTADTKWMPYTEDQIGKYVRVSVIPVDDQGEEGPAAESNIVRLTAPPAPVVTATNFSGDFKVGSYLTLLPEINFYNCGDGGTQIKFYLAGNESQGPVATFNRGETAQVLLKSNMIDKNVYYTVSPINEYKTKGIPQKSSVHKITTDPPLVSAVTIRETITDHTVDAIRPGMSLTVTYTYVDSHFDESTSRYQWYRGDRRNRTDSTLTEISGATGSTYTATADDVGSWLTVRVIPVNLANYAGESKWSGNATIVSNPVVSDIRIGQSPFTNHNLVLDYDFDDVSNADYPVNDQSRITWYVYDNYSNEYMVIPNEHTTTLDYLGNPEAINKLVKCVITARNAHVTGESLSFIYFYEEYLTPDRYEWKMPDSSLSNTMVHGNIYLVAGGGGGGSGGSAPRGKSRADGAGGGGAGEVVIRNDFTFTTSRTYIIRVGAGGDGGDPASKEHSGNTGENGDASFMAWKDANRPMHYANGGTGGNGGENTDNTGTWGTGGMGGHNKGKNESDPDYCHTCDGDDATGTFGANGGYNENPYYTGRGIGGQANGAHGTWLIGSNNGAAPDNSGGGGGGSAGAQDVQSSLTGGNGGSGFARFEVFGVFPGD